MSTDPSIVPVGQPWLVKPLAWGVWIGVRNHPGEDSPWTVTRIDGKVRRHLADDEVSPLHPVGPEPGEG